MEQIMLHLVLFIHHQQNQIHHLFLLIF